jgi:hypothetical protein
MLRRALWVPCETSADLHRWIRNYLGLNIPDGLVDPESTASPMGIIWEVYDAARRNNRPEFNQVLAFSSRDSFKTLSAAVLEVLAVLHLGRDVAHMAAVEQQAKKAQSYVKRFFRRPYLRDFVGQRSAAQNERRTEVVRYSRGPGAETLTVAAWEALPLAERDRYERLENYIQIVICTMAGANSEHVPFMVIDEVDVVPRQHVAAYEEAKYIPAPFDAKLPLTLLTSTRKSSFGLVQKELDEAPQTGLEVRHWNIIDVTRRCPPVRHLPAEPRIPIYYSDDNLRAIGEADYLLLNAEDQKKYSRDEGYAGCLRNCRLFAACRGRLATRQTSSSSLLKPIEHVQQVFRKVSIESAQAQLLCRKPPKTGLIYPRLDSGIHGLTAAQMAERLTGEPQRPDLGKAELLAVMKSVGTLFASGMDFGFTHNFAVVSGAIQGACLYVFDVLSIAGLELDQKLALCGTAITWGPRIWPDMAYPADIKTFQRRSEGRWNLRRWEKKPGSVKDGIEAVRAKLAPAGGDPTLYYLLGDPGCELLAVNLGRYHFELDAAGKPTDIPSEENDDEADALRYLVLNEFPVAGRRGLAVPETGPTPSAEVEARRAEQYTASNWMEKKVAELTGGEDALLVLPEYVKKKGKFVFSG